jgi:uracil-DNA glycosylase
MSREAYVSELPACDICKHEQDRITEAHYDGRTTTGQWANMCDVHFATRGIGLGTGRGQKLIVGEKPVETEERKRRKIREAINQGDFDAAEELIGDGDPADFF